MAAGEPPWPDTSYDVTFRARPRLVGGGTGTIAAAQHVTVAGPRTRGLQGVHLQLRRRPPTTPLRSVRVHSSVQAAGVLDGDAKTVVRLSLEHAHAVGTGGRRVALAPRLSVQGVLGYDRDYERTLGVLRDALGFEPAPQPLYDAAVSAVGGRPEGMPSKPDVDLDGATPAQAFRKVIAPLAAPGIVTAAILVFIFAWNDLLLALSLTATMTSPD